MQIAYICSPYRAAGELEKETIKLIHKRNVEYARELTRKAIQVGLAPITPHLYITQVVDDEIEQERQQGLKVGLAILGACDLLVLGERYGMSAGMSGEIKKAEEMGVQIITEKELDTLREANEADRLHNKESAGDSDYRTHYINRFMRQR